MWKDIYHRVRRMRTLGTIARMAGTCGCVALMAHPMARAGERRVWISWHLKDVARKSISDEDTIERILEKAGGPVVLKDGRKVPLRYAKIYMDKQVPEKQSRVVVKRRDWHRKIGEFAPVHAVTVIDFIDPEAHLWEGKEAEAADQDRQPSPPAPKGNEKPTPPGAPAPSGTHKPEKSQPPAQKPTHSTGGNGGPEPAKPKQP